MKKETLMQRSQVGHFRILNWTKARVHVVFIILASLVHHLFIILSFVFVLPPSAALYSDAHVPRENVYFLRMSENEKKMVRRRVVSYWRDLGRTDIIYKVLLQLKKLSDSLPMTQHPVRVNEPAAGPTKIDIELTSDHFSWNFLLFLVINKCIPQEGLF